MRVIQTKNDTIRLIFNPKTDGLCLSDFLIVRDGEDNFLGQIIEIYDDKFNQEENVAVIRLVYRILADREIVPYDNFTPSRECEIAKIKLEEIEKCINTDKTTVPFGISTKTKEIVNVNLDFFNNNAVIFADKLDEVNMAFENLSQKLKTFKKVVVVDYTGNLNIQNAKRLKATVDFKLPLDFYSLDYIWQKAMKDISMEAEGELEEMFDELKKFVNSTEDKYIPFPRFIKVIEQQYKTTPAPELRLLLGRLKRYWSEELFARSKKEFQGIEKNLQKENVIILDFSTLKRDWHKEFLEFTVRQIRDFETYLLLRLNENNSNPEIISNLYLKNPKVSVIPSISYGFAKMPCIMEFVRNYILYKTLNPRRDFGFANAQVASLNSCSFLIFGADTMDFMFTLKNYVYDEENPDKNEEKKIYIDLNLELEEMTSVELAGGDFEFKNIHIQSAPPKAKRLDEVTIEAAMQKAPKGEEIVPDTASQGAGKEPADKEQNKEDIPAEENRQDKEEDKAHNPGYTLHEVGVSSTDVPDIEEESEEAAFDETQEVDTLDEAREDIPEDDSESAVEAEIPLAEDELDYFVNNEEEPLEDEEAPKEAQTSKAALEETEEDDQDFEDDVITPEMIENSAASEELAKELEDEDEEPSEEETEEDIEETADEEVSGTEIIEETPQTDTQEDTEDETAVSEVPAQEEFEAPESVSVDEENREVPAQEFAVENAPEDIEKTPQEEAPSEPIIIVKEKPNLLIDDFSEPEEETPEPEQDEEPQTEQNAPQTVEEQNAGMEETQTQEEDNSLKELARNSIEARFDEVIEEGAAHTKVSSAKNKLRISENVSIDLDEIQNKTSKAANSLPVFNNAEDDDEETEEEQYDYTEGMKVSHEKYGEGTILKVVKYSNRCLLQIEFTSTGKRLLDPKIAKIRPA